MSIRLPSCGPLRKKICPDSRLLRRRRRPVEQSHTLSRPRPSPSRLGRLVCVLHATATPAQHDDGQLISRFGCPLYCCSLFVPPSLRAALPCPSPSSPFSHSRELQGGRQVRRREERSSCRFGSSVWRRPPRWRPGAAASAARAIARPGCGCAARGSPPRRRPRRRGRPASSWGQSRPPARRSSRRSTTRCICLPSPPSPCQKEASFILD